METYRIIFKVLLTAVTLSVMVSCDDDDDDDRKLNVKINEVRNVALDGQWHITSFIDSGDDETDNFSGYTFDFATGNTLTATNGSNTYTGTWSVTDDDSNDDSNDLDDIDFNIAFAAPPDFQELTEDWEIISQSATQIALRHVSGGGGGTDLLTFERD